MNDNTLTAEMPETKRKLVDAGVNLMRVRGYSATTVDDICAAAKVTKGGFFHYFKSKEEMAKAAVLRFCDGKSLDFQDAPFRKLADPLDRILGRLDYVKEMTSNQGHVTKGCLVGMLAQELSATSPELRAACENLFARLAKDVEKDLTEAKAAHAPDADFDVKSVALFYISVVQGSMVMAKAMEDNAVLLNNIDHFRTYLNSLFASAKKPGTRTGRLAVH